MTEKTKKSTRVWRSHRGPKVYMTDHEYSSTKKRAASAKLSINRYIRRAALTCDIGGDLVPGLMGRVDRVGHKLNDLMHFVNRGGEIDSEVLWRMLLELEHTLDAIPETEWIPVYQTRRGKGKRKHRGWVRGSLEELAKIKERAELVGLSQAGFVRAAALQGPLGRKAWSGVILGLLRWRSNLVQMMECRFATAGIVDKAMNIGREVVRLNHEFMSGKYRSQRQTKHSSIN